MNGLPARIVSLDISAYDVGILKGVLRGAGYDNLADQIEAQTKPARIPEPGWGEKVRAQTLGSGGLTREFLRYKADDPDFRWADGVEQYRWPDLIDPTLVREGLS